ncbi:MAG: hypothetical protein ACTSPI_06015 [Candidatus Heimdallarchaeaceae archaeon]
MNYGRLFKCLNCKLEAHRDAVGCANVGIAQVMSAAPINGVVTHPLLL